MTILTILSFICCFYRFFLQSFILLPPLFLSFYSYFSLSFSTFPLIFHSFFTLQFANIFSSFPSFFLHSPSTFLPFFLPYYFFPSYISFPSYLLPLPCYLNFFLLPHTPFFYFLPPYFPPFFLFSALRGGKIYTIINILIIVCLPTRSLGMHEW